MRLFIEFRGGAIMTFSVENLIALISIIFASTGLWHLIASIYQNKSSNRQELEKKKIEKNDAIANGVLAILHHRLDLMMERAILRKKIGIKERERIDVLYKPYIDLGGNGLIKARYEQIVDLEVVDDTTIEELDLQNTFAHMIEDTEFRDFLRENLTRY